MKDFYKNILVLSVALVIGGCSDVDDIASTSRVTFFPDFIFEGEKSYNIPCGEAFSLPGVRVEEEGVEIDFETSISGLYFNKTASGTMVNTEIPDLYTVTYSAVNKDGFSGSSDRTVRIQPCAGDMVNSIEGEYISTVVRGGNFDPQYVDLGPVYIADLGDNVYGISHALGGYYDYGRGFGAGYASYGALIKANDIGANDFSTLELGVFPIWGNVVEISGVSVDASAKTITFTGTGNFGNGVFDVTLKQVE